MLEIRGLRRDYDGRTVVSVPSWDVERGAASLVLGPSGSGKTTLLNAIAALTLAEVVTLLVAGAILGLAFGHGAAHALGLWLAGAGSWPLTGLARVPGETVLAAAVLAAGALTCLIPAVQAYSSDPASLLAKR